MASAVSSSPTGTCRPYGVDAATRWVQPARSACQNGVLAATARAASTMATAASTNATTPPTMTPPMRGPRRQTSGRVRSASAVSSTIASVVTRPMPGTAAAASRASATARAAVASDALSALESTMERRRRRGGSATSGCPSIESSSAPTAAGRSRTASASALPDISNMRDRVVARAAATMRIATPVSVSRVPGSSRQNTSPPTDAVSAPPALAVRGTRAATWETAAPTTVSAVITMVIGNTTSTDAPASQTNVATAIGSVNARAPKAESETRSRNGPNCSGTQLTARTVAPATRASVAQTSAVRPGRERLAPIA